MHPLRFIFFVELTISFGHLALDCTDSIGGRDTVVKGTIDDGIEWRAIVLFPYCLRQPPSLFIYSAILAFMESFLLASF